MNWAWDMEVPSHDVDGDDDAWLLMLVFDTDAIAVEVK